jgi:predicted ATPase/transcriptional regulator with XRE-family HTH domain/predicted negative regulator of RcsB-dependent stress response
LEKYPLAEISFGEWLKRQRKAQGFTQEQLAQQVGCSTIALRKIEAEERRPSEQIAVRLADIFHVPDSERTVFLRFARGQVDATLGETSPLSPWSASASRASLPATYTSLIGRGEEIAAIREYLQNPDTRLVTLVGPPGIGKTRLSVETARASLADFPDGVFFVPLAPLDDASVIVPTIVQVLGYVEVSNVPIDELLTKNIGDKRLLLVLDNCEHMIDSVAGLAAGLLPACPALTILATSREALRVPGEWIYPVPTLNLPVGNALLSMDMASQFPALTLFAERARAARPDFKLTPENIETVARICAQLDGLPLAIELIAARMRIMSPQMLLEKMTGQFILSADGMRAVSARQKTLNNAIGWSYDSLDGEERNAFTALAVFSGGFTLEAAEAVLARSGVERSAFDLVTSLADKSLVHRSFDPQEQVRYSMLDTIQQFALDRLRGFGSEANLRLAHLEYFMGFVEQGAREMRGPHQVEWTDRIQNEQDNIRAALESAASNQKTESALRLLHGLDWPWEIRGHYGEAIHWLERIRALPDADKYPLLLSGVLSHIGRYNWTQNRPHEAGVMLEQSRALAVSMAEPGEIALAEVLNWLGLLAIDTDKSVTRACLEQSRALNTKWKNSQGAALNTFHLGMLARELGDHERARTLLEQGLAEFQRFGDRFFISRVSINLGYLFLKQNDYDQAQRLFEASLNLDRELRFWNGIADALYALGDLYRQKGESDQAQRQYQLSLEMRHAHGLAV